MWFVCRNYVIMDIESLCENVLWRKWMVEYKYMVCIEWMIMNDLIKIYGLYLLNIVLNWCLWIMYLNYWFFFWVFFILFVFDY